MPERQGPACQEGTFAHALNPDGLVIERRGQTTSVVIDGQLDHVIFDGERDPAVRGLRVAQDVGQGLLGNAVDHELELRRERREIAGQMSLNA